MANARESWKGIATEQTLTDLVNVMTGASISMSAEVNIADGADITLGSKADAKSTATDTTPATLVQIAKEISYMEQNPASRAVTNAGTFAVQVSSNTDGTQKTQIVGSTGTQAEVVAASASKSGSDNVILVQTIDASGNIGTGGSAVDKASFTVGSGKGSVMMGVVSTDTVSTGQEGAVQITGARELAVHIADGAQVAIGSTTDAPNSSSTATAATLMGIWKYLSGLWQSLTTTASTARTTSTPVIATQSIGPSGYPADVTSVNELKVFNPPISILAEYRSPTDFQAAYASSSTLQLTGAQFTIDDTVCRATSVMVKNASGVFTGYFNGRGGISLQLSAGTLTIVGATPFLNTDLVYDVNIVGPKKAYDISTDTTKVAVQNPQNLNFVVDVLVNTTNTANGTVYYPSSTGMQMDGYLNMSLSGQLIDVGGITITVEGTNDPSATPNWIQLYGDDLKNNTMTNIKNTVSDTFFWSFDNLNVSTIRVKVVYTTNGANTSIINMRRA